MQACVADLTNVNKHLIFSYMAIRPPRSSSETIVHIFVTPVSSWNGILLIRGGLEPNMNNIYINIPIKYMYYGHILRYHSVDTNILLACAIRDTLTD